MQSVQHLKNKLRDNSETVRDRKSVYGLSIGTNLVAPYLVTFRSYRR